MGVIDLPLDELERYNGRNPCPSDFDEYWERATDELATTPEELDMRPAAFTSRAADAFDLYFTGVRNARIYAKILVPKGAERAPAVLVFHGYSGDSGDWSEKLNLVSEGFVVAAMDVRGQGGRSTDPGGAGGTTFYGHIIRGAADSPDQLLFRHIYLDA